MCHQPHVSHSALLVPGLNVTSLMNQGEILSEPLQDSGKDYVIMYVQLLKHLSLMHPGISCYYFPYSRQRAINSVVQIPSPACPLKGSLLGADVKETLEGCFQSE